MKKFIYILTSLVVALGINVGAASALERIAVTFNDNNLYIKDGPTYAQWSQITTGVNIGNFSLSNDRVVVLDQGSTAKFVSIKEPSWNSPFNATYFTDGGQPAATKALTSQLSNGQYRLLVLRADGSVVMKDGPWNTAWWSGTIEPSGVSKIVIGGDRIGLIMNDGSFKVKELVPGQFSHPNNTGWSLVGDNVTEAALSNSRIAILKAGAVWAKEGPVNSAWFTGSAQGPIIYDYAIAVRMAGDRLCAIVNPGTIEVKCKEGAFSAAPKLTYTNAVDFKVSATRFMALTATGKAEVMEGSLTNNSGWNFVTFNNATGIELN